MSAKDFRVGANRAGYGHQSHPGPSGYDEGDSTFLLENFFVLRLPEEEAEKLAEMLKSAPESVKGYTSRCRFFLFSNCHGCFCFRCVIHLLGRQYEPCAAITNSHRECE